MINKNEFPILEFDNNKNAKITPQLLEERPYLGIEYGVICFDIKTKENFIKNYLSEIIGEVCGCGIESQNIYKVNFEENDIVLIQGIIGGPLAAVVMEDLVAFGCKKVIAVGSAGVLNKEIARGHLIVPTEALRHEGTSYHYVPASRYIKHNPEVIKNVTDFLAENKIPFVCGKTWTTDAIYRETEDLVAERQKENCICVEMENATFGAVAQYHNIKFAQILYGADCLDGKMWNRRDWKSDEIRQNSKYELLKLAMRLVTKID